MSEPQIPRRPDAECFQVNEKTLARQDATRHVFNREALSKRVLNAERLLRIAVSYTVAPAVDAKDWQDFVQGVRDHFDRHVPAPRARQD